PDALVINLARLDCTDAKALFVFGALARRASLWPGIPVILSAPDPVLRTDLARHGVDRVVAVCAAAAEARLLAPGAPRPPPAPRRGCGAPSCPYAGRRGAPATWPPRPACAGRARS